MPSNYRAVIHSQSPPNIILNVARTKCRIAKSMRWSKPMPMVMALNASIKRSNLPMVLRLLDLAEAKRIRALGWTGPVLLLEGIFTEQDLFGCHLGIKLQYS